MSFIYENIGTIIVTVCLISLIIFIIKYMFKEKSKGKSVCGCNCKECASYGMCHKKIL